MKPTVLIYADDIPLALDRFVRLSVTDEAGFHADRLTLVYDNRDYALAIPPKGNELDVSLGYDENLTRIGTYIVDEVETRGGKKATLTVRAKAADMLASLKVKKTRDWFDITLGEVVSQIAVEHGLSPRISADLAGHLLAPIPYQVENQTDESDLHFLRRLARRFDSVCKPVAGHLICVPKGEAKSAGGAVLKTIEIADTEVSEWTASAPERDKYKSVRAHWRDGDNQTRETVSAGAGEPSLSLRDIYPDQPAAQAAAEARLKAVKRGAATLSFSMTGRPEIAAEMRLVFTSRDPLANGDWIVSRVTHELSKSGAFISRVECETPNGVSR